MKIIGKSDDGYVLQASRTEMARLCGYYSQHSDGAVFNPGDDINISAMYQYLYDLSNFKEDMEFISRKFEEYAAALKDIPKPITFTRKMLNELR